MPYSGHRAGGPGYLFSMQNVIAYPRSFAYQMDMRVIGSLADEKAAWRFGDYLHFVGITKEIKAKLFPYMQMIEMSYLNMR